MRRVRAGLLLIATTVGCVSLLAPAASAATQVGETFLPNATFVTDYTLLQTSSQGGQYRVPAPGVITSWSYEADASPPAATTTRPSATVRLSSPSPTS